MSHFTKVATKINDLVALREGARSARLEVHARREQGVEVRGWRGPDDQGRDVPSTWASTTSAWSSRRTAPTRSRPTGGASRRRTGLKEEEVVKELNAKYAYQRVVAAVEEQGYTIDQNAVQKDGTVKLCCARLVTTIVARREAPARDQ